MKRNRIWRMRWMNNFSWLLRDEFADTRAAGAVNNTVGTPGGTGGSTLNTRTVVDPTSGLSLSGGQCNIVASGVGWAQPGLWYGQYAQAAGLMFGCKFLRTNATQFRFGPDGDQTGALDGGAEISGTDIYARMQWGGNSAIVGAWALDTEYRIAFVWRSIGAFFLIAGGAYADWRLLYPAAGYAALNPYYGISCVDGDGWNDDFTMQLLGSPWDDDYGIATQQLAGARASGDTFTHEADCSIEFQVMGLPAALQIELRFRIQDATNYWQITIDSAGDLDLDEVVAGAPTQRGPAAGVIVGGERIVISAHGQTIDVFDPGSRHIHYTSASNFATETDGELETEGTGGSVWDIVSWPYAITGTAKALLDKYHPN